MRGRIVVGVDGSPAALAAVEWAASEAGRREAELVVCSVVEQPGTQVPGVGAGQVAGGYPVTEHSEDADLLVLGTAGHTGAAALLLGSVSEQCLRHATCPVMATRAADHECQRDPDRDGSTQLTT